MEGDREIVLIEPGPQVQDSLGQVHESSPIRHARWARRLDRGGGEIVDSSTVVGSWQTRFEVRYLGLENIDQSWILVDERGREYDIERISESPYGRNRHWYIYAVSRQGIRTEGP